MSKTCFPDISVLFRSARGRRLTPLERKDISVSPIFASKPVVATSAMRALLRFLVGMEDFARVNGHYKRRAEGHTSLAFGRGRLQTVMSFMPCTP